jgi:hypothetical protein
MHRTAAPSAPKISSRPPTISIAMIGIGYPLWQGDTRKIFDEAGGREIAIVYFASFALRLSRPAT